MPDEVMFATPKTLVPSEKVTVPVAPGLSVAVKTTLVPKTEGFIEELIVSVAASPRSIVCVYGLEAEPA